MPLMNPSLDKLSGIPDLGYLEVSLKIILIKITGTKI